MFPEISSIQKKRKKFNLTQKDLANGVGISQSMIAKLESNKLEPSYSIATKIFTYLDEFENTKTRICSEIMSKKICSVNSNDLIEKGIKFMKEKGISQIPVKEGDFFVGVLSEAILYSKLEEGMKREELFSKKIKDIMGSALPIVGYDTPVYSIIPLLKFNNAILIREKKDKKIVGIITKSDLL